MSRCGAGPRLAREGGWKEATPFAAGGRLALGHMGWARFEAFFINQGLATLCVPGLASLRCCMLPLPTGFPILAVTTSMYLLHSRRLNEHVIHTMSRHPLTWIRDF